MPRKGFTLIEMLVVIAIIGILAALFIPQIAAAIQKSRQKGTMKDINSIATALADYVSDKGAPPAHNTILVSGDMVYQSLSGFYLKVLPLNDQWGGAFWVWGGIASENAYDGVTGTDAGDFIVASQGRDKAKTPIVFDPLVPSTIYFDITAMSSFNEDLVNWNGSWIHVPKGAQIGS